METWDWFAHSKLHHKTLGIRGALSWKRSLFGNLGSGIDICIRSPDKHWHFKIRRRRFYLQVAYNVDIGSRTQNPNTFWVTPGPRHYISHNYNDTYNVLVFFKLNLSSVLYQFVKNRHPKLYTITSDSISACFYIFTHNLCLRLIKKTVAATRLLLLVCSFFRSLFPFFIRQ